MEATAINDETTAKDETAPKDETRLSLKSRIALTICALIIASLFMGVIVAAVKSPPEPALLVVVQRGNNHKIVYDRETKVMYSMTDGKYNTGELFPLYNPDGSLKLYEK